MLSDLVRLDVRQILEEALNGKVRDLLGCGYYDHQDEAGGYRNCYRSGRMQTSEGEIHHASPQVRGQDGTKQTNQ